MKSFITNFTACIALRITGQSCIGHSIGTFESGSTVQSILNNLHVRFCGCVHITGSILINLHNSDFSRQLNADDFNMFYHLEQVTEVIRFLNLPNTSDIILPNLRIIRAQELVASEFSLLVQNSIIDRLILPKLTQISRGNVIIENTPNLCNYLQVRWTDIIDGGGTLIDNTGTCVERVSSNPDCKFSVFA